MVWSLVASALRAHQRMTRQSYVLQLLHWQNWEHILDSSGNGGGSLWVSFGFHVGSYGLSIGSYWVPMGFL